MTNVEAKSVLEGARTAMTRNPADNVYEELKRKITDGDYYPSQRLVENQLAETFSTSRHNVRAALSRLQVDGLVEIQPNRGASVASLTLDQAIDILVAREALERAVARLAAMNADAQAVAELSEHVRHMESALMAGDYDLYSQTNRLFHGAICAASGNESLPALIGLLRGRLTRLHLRTILVPGRSARSLAEHRELYEAIEAHDPDRAEAAASNHLRSMRETIEQAWNLVRV